MNSQIYIASIRQRTQQQAQTYNDFNGHFSGKPGSASYSWFSVSSFILILSIFTGQVEPLLTHFVVCAVPCPLILTAIVGGFEAHVSQAGCPSCRPTNSVKALKMECVSVVHNINEETKQYVHLYHHSPDCHISDMQHAEKTTTDLSIWQ